MVIQTQQMSTDNSVIATVSLVNSYQDTTTYKPLIFDNDKKKVASYLLKQIVLTESEWALLYAKDGLLLAYAYQCDNVGYAGITTYKNGLVQYLVNNGQDNEWLPHDLSPKIVGKIEPLDDQQSLLSYPGEIRYQSMARELLVENNRLVMREIPGTGLRVLGLVRVVKSLDDKYFTEASRQSGTEISLLLNNEVLLNDYAHLLPIEGLAQYSSLYGNPDHEIGELLNHDTHYIHSYSWPTENKIDYLLISSPKADLLTVINRTRLSLAFIFVTISIVAIGIGVYWLNTLITKPINTLIEHARLDNGLVYPQFPADHSSYEISRLGEVLNGMVAAVKEREQQLRLSEEQLKNAQMFAKMGNWWVGQTNKEILFSDEVYSILEVERDRVSPSGDLIKNLIHPDDLELVHRHYEESKANRTPYDIVHRLKMKDGSTKYVHVYTTTEFDDDGNPLSTSGTIQDVTEQTVKDEQLRRTQKMESLGQLVGGVAHDFNNVLGVVIGYSELLKEDLDEGSENASYADFICQAGERARKLTSQLLAFSRKDTTTAKQADLNQLLQDQQHMLEKTMTVRVKLVFDLAQDLWPVFIDKDDLEDAILNMCINSMHAMPEGGDLVLATRNVVLSEIDVRHKDVLAGEYVLFSLTDTGIGMDRNTLRRIFEPFFSTKKKRGTGLGMSQVYGFVKRSKGEVNVYSEPGLGTRFSIYFPRHHDSVENDQAAKQMEVEEDFSGHGTILVVDDEPALRTLSEEMLSRKGYRVLCADGGKQALKILESEVVDLMLSDVIMPEMDGYRLAEEVKKMYPEVKILMASGFAEGYANGESSTDELHLQRLQKPFTARVLLERVKELLG